MTKEDRIILLKSIDIWEKYKYPLHLPKDNNHLFIDNG